MFCTLVQNISKADDEEMAKMYQHILRILHSFGDGDGGVIWCIKCIKVSGKCSLKCIFLFINYNKNKDIYLSF